MLLSKCYTSGGGPLSSLIPCRCTQDLCDGKEMFVTRRCTQNFLIEPCPSWTLVARLDLTYLALQNCHTIVPKVIDPMAEILECFEAPQPCSRRDHYQGIQLDFELKCAPLPSSTWSKSPSQAGLAPSTKPQGRLSHICYPRCPAFPKQWIRRQEWRPKSAWSHSDGVQVHQISLHGKRGSGISLPTVKQIMCVTICMPLVYFRFV